MAELRPFGALRYAAVDELGPVLAPPFDVVSPEAQDELHEQDPHNVIRLELARGGTDQPHAGRYAEAAKTLREWRRRNVLGHDARPGYYPYEEAFAGPTGDSTRRGFFATIRLHPWSDRIVLPHERTRPKPKADRLELLHACDTQFSPIFCMFEDPGGEVRELLDEAVRAIPISCGRVESTAGAEIAREHTLWWLVNKAAQRLTDLFVHRQLFIADGHHRYETALAYRDERRASTDRWDAAASYEYVMGLLVPIDDPGLVVLPTHRLITAADSICADKLLKTWESEFRIEKMTLPERAPGAALTEVLARRSNDHVFGVVGLQAGVAHVLTLRALPREWSSPETWRHLDVGLLEALIVEPLKHEHPGLGIEFAHDPEETIAHGRDGDRNMAILLNPTTVRETLSVARAGEVMPEKSTYFTPKVATGLVMYPLD